MSLNKFLKNAYNSKVTVPHGYEEVADSVVVKSTHHSFFKALKLTGVVAASTVGAFVLVAAGSVIISSLEIHDHPESVQKARFSVYDANLIKTSTFQRLNTINYTAEQEKNPIDADFKYGVDQFACDSFATLDKTKNYAYSPLMLYTQLDLISCAVSDEETMDQFNSVLSGDASLRKTGIAASMRNNFFANDERKSTVQAKNAVFLEEELGAKDQFVQDMTERNAEVFEMDFQNPEDVGKACQWANASVNQPGFLKAEDLKIEDDSGMLFLSTLYFDNAWTSRFIKEDTKPDDFHLLDGTTVQKDFMNHITYAGFTDQVTYVSVTDYYNSDYSIQYFVPKNVKDNIFELLPKDFLFKQDQKKEIVSLSLPKMSLTCESDLSKMVQDLGITNPYVKKSNHLKNAFRRGDELVYSYLNYTKQKTNVSFDEDGTIVKSITFSLAPAGTSAAHMDDGYHVELNQPFVYCIRDPMGLPLVVGSVLNPSN